MNKEILKNSFVNGSFLFIALLIVDFITELFQINESGTVVTFLGIKIITHMTSKELTTSIGITIGILFWYVITIIICYGGALIVSRTKK